MLVTSNPSHRASYQDGWARRNRPAGYGTIKRAWAMGRDDAFACAYYHGKAEDYKLV
jgi:hypothetical protein